MARISIFGLGYVGSVSIAALAAAGHELIGVDPNTTKVDMINSGRSPVIEAGLDDLLAGGLQRGAIRATTDAEEAVRESDVSIVCVGTPSHPNGSIDLTYVEKVSQEIGSSVATTDSPHIVVLRSTMMPGSTEEVVIPILEESSGRRIGPDLGVCFNPEFLREGSSIRDFYEPPFTLIGAGDDDVASRVGSLYDTVDAQVVIAPIRVAEMVKYASNAFHALKVVFANEIGNICAEQGIDSHRVMEIFSLDEKLNISSAYLRPGFAFGGSCLPKDLRALRYQARRLDLEVPVLDAILQSNRRQVERALRMVTDGGRKRVGVLGFSFKAGTDDLRESPMVDLIERLIGKGYDVRVYDRNVSLANLQGANRAYIEREIPHIASLMADTPEEVIADSDVIVIGNSSPEFARVPLEARADQLVVDLVRIGEDANAGRAAYRGISW